MDRFERRHPRDGNPTDETGAGYDRQDKDRCRSVRSVSTPRGTAREKAGR